MQYRSTANRSANSSDVKDSVSPRLQPAVPQHRAQNGTKIAPPWPRRPALDRAGAKRRVTHALASNRRTDARGDSASVVGVPTTRPPPPPVTTRPSPDATSARVASAPDVASPPTTTLPAQHQPPRADDVVDTVDADMPQAGGIDMPSPATNTGSTTPSDSVLMPPPQPKRREPEHQRLWDIRAELKELPNNNNSAGRSNEIVGQAAGLLAKAEWPIPPIKHRSTAVDILVCAVERKPTNGALQSIMTAAMDTIRIGRADDNRRAENLAKHLWQRIMSLEGPRASLLFKPIFQKYMATHDVYGDDIRRSFYKWTIQAWADQVEVTAAPFTAVDCTLFVDQLEACRFDDDAGLPSTVAKSPNDTTVWSSGTPTTPALSPADADTFRYVVWNGNGFVKRFNNGDITDMLVNERPAVYAVLETRIDTEHLAKPCTVREFFYAMGYSLVCWNSSKKNYSNHGVLVAVRADLADEVQIHAGLGVPASDEEGRVLTIEFDDHAAVIAYAPCTQWGTPRPCAKRAVFQEGLRCHLVEWNERKPTMLLGDLNVAPTEADRTYYPPVPDDATTCDHHPHSGVRTMDRKTMSSCKDSERRWHADLLAETNMVDAICPDPAASDPNPISWAKTPALWAKDEGLRVDHVLAPQTLLDTSDFPHIDRARLGTDTYNSDHVAVIVDVARNADHVETYARVRRERLEPAELINLAGSIAYATSAETRKIASSTVASLVGARMPELPRIGQADADAVFVNLIRVLGEIDNELDPLFASAAAPPATANPGPQPSRDGAQRRRRTDEDYANSDECRLDDPPPKEEAVAAAILANVHSAYHSTGPSRRGRIYAEVSVTAGHADETGPTEFVQALLDTGAAHGIINQELTHRLKLPLKTHAEPMSFRMADGSTRRSPGRVDLRLAMANDVEATVELHVLPDCPYGIIIGNDFLETAGSVLDYRRHEWRFLEDPEDDDSEVTVEFTPRKGSAPGDLEWQRFREVFQQWRHHRHVGERTARRLRGA